MSTPRTLFSGQRSCVLLRGGHAECTQMLIEAESDVTAEDYEGWRAMDFAENVTSYNRKTEGHTACVALLKEAMPWTVTTWVMTETAAITADGTHPGW